MIIPVRCFSCGKVLADKWEYYQRRVKEKEAEQSGGGQPKKAATKKSTSTSDEEQPVKSRVFDKVYTGEILDELGLEKQCCRRMMLGHVDLIEII